MNNFVEKDNKNNSYSYMTSEEIEIFFKDILVDIKDIKQRLHNIESFIKNKK